jgi:hypothetical protein
MHLGKMTEESSTTMAQSKGPPIWKKIVDRLGLDIPTLLIMFKYANAKLLPLL